MGWFWADPSPSIAPRVRHRRDGAPPPNCPMHRPSTNTGSGCPYVPPDAPTPAAASTTTITTITETSARPPSASTFSKLNPLNYMPFELPQSRAPGQTHPLPVSRETSTIPKADGSLWEYPSPQQMYNAMLRKGYMDTPQDAVESMVAVHNFLNEGAWDEIRGWERRFGRGLAEGWRKCARGEDDWDDDGASAATTFASAASRAPLATPARGSGDATPEPRLVRFMGRPGELTPKARVLQTLGWIYPARFATAPPFDRHDWYVQRDCPDGTSREVRYVIDYYSGPPEPSGEEVFYLDVRPAVDSPTAAVERAMRWGGDIWWRASGGVAREAEQARKDGGR